jgi:hypothetical protein
MRAGSIIQEGRTQWTRDKMRMLITQLDRTLLYRSAQFNRWGNAIDIAVAMVAVGACWFGGQVSEASQYVQVPAIWAWR